MFFVAMIVILSSLCALVFGQLVPCTAGDPAFISQYCHDVFTILFTTTFCHRVGKLTLLQPSGVVAAFSLISDSFNNLDDCLSFVFAVFPLFNIS